MKLYYSFITGCLLLILFSDGFSREKVYSVNDIKKLSHLYVNNNLGIKNPVVVDVDNDGVFDILKFTKKGTVDYYSNKGTVENPEFELAKKNFDSYEMHSLLKGGIPVTIFFADNDGDGDKDIFGVYKDGFDVKSGIQKYNVTYAENSFELDHYTLITIILVLLIVLLLVTIL